MSMMALKSGVVVPTPTLFWAETETTKSVQTTLKALAKDLNLI
jgi:hypothetical protein